MTTDRRIDARVLAPLYESLVGALHEHVAQARRCSITVVSVVGGCILMRYPTDRRITPDCTRCMIAKYRYLEANALYLAALRQVFG
jgi:hypothetical protein